MLLRSTTLDNISGYPRHDDIEGAFNWEDLADKKYWVLWIAVFALYPLLRRRPSDG